jgi:hypothetical protein
MLAALVACSPPADDVAAEPWSGPDGLRFERLARVVNPGLGVVAARDGGAWLARDGVLAWVDAVDGAVVETVHVDGRTVDGLMLLDADADGWWVALDAHQVAWVDRSGAIVDALDLPGPIRTGGLSVEGAWVTWDAPDGACDALLLSDPGASTDAIGAVRCDAERPVHSDASRAAIDDGALFALEPGTDVLDRIDRTTGQTKSLMLDRPAIDVAARGGQVVVLSEDGIMAHVAPDTGETLAEWHVHRPASIGSIALTAQADTIVLASDEAVVFFALDPEAPGFPLVEGGGNAGSTPGGGASGSVSGGGGGGASAGSAGSANHP